MRNPILAVVTFVALGSLAANVLLYNRYSSSRPIMRVGEQVITRKEYQERMDYEFGKQVLNKIAYRKMILQAASKAGVSPTEAEISTRIADIERRNPTLLDTAKSDAVKFTEMREDLRTDVAFENIRIKSVNVSEAELVAFYEKNRASFKVPSQSETTLVIAQSSLDAATAQALLEQNIKPDVIARQPRLRVVGVGGFALNMNQLPPSVVDNLNTTVARLKPGQVTSVPVGRDFVIIRLNNRNEAAIPPLYSMRPLVTRLAKLSKAENPDLVLAKMYRDSSVIFEMEKYAAYFDDIASLPVTKPASAKPASAKR